MSMEWQCTSSKYHVMVREVPRCTLCGADVEKVYVSDSIYYDHKLQTLSKSVGNVEIDDSDTICREVRGKE